MDGRTASSPAGGVVERATNGRDASVCGEEYPFVVNLQQRNYRGVVACTTARAVVNGTS